MASMVIPDNSILRRIGTFGDILYIQIVDDKNNVIDLTNSTLVSIKIQHESIITDNVVRPASIMGSAVNGTIYYSTTVDDFKNPGRYYISSVVNSTGKSIISYQTTPNFIQNQA